MGAAAGSGVLGDADGRGVSSVAPGDGAGELVRIPSPFSAPQAIIPAPQVKSMRLIPTVAIFTPCLLNIWRQLLAGNPVVVAVQVEWVALADVGRCYLREADQVTGVRGYSIGSPISITHMAPPNCPLARPPWMLPDSTLSPDSSNLPSEIGISSAIP